MSNDEMTNDNTPENEAQGAKLSPRERDTIAEVTGLSMGAAGATLGSVLGQEVEVAQPTVDEIPSLEALGTTNVPFGDTPKSLICIEYTAGDFPSFAFVVKNADIAKLTEMMLGSSEEGAADGELTELQVGAVSELMNQMMNAAAGNLASVVHSAVEIGNPQVMPYSVENLTSFIPRLAQEPLAWVNCTINVPGAGMTLEMIQLMMASEAIAQTERLLAVEPETSGDGAGSLEMSEEAIDELLQGAGMEALVGVAAEAGSASSGRGGAPPAAKSDPSVTVRPVEFGSFDHQPSVYGEENKNLELVMDVTLNLTVELGKTTLSIKDVLELTRGSVLELERVAGEPVDLMANGKLIAKGEVVVIEDNFGLRITSIVSPADRLRGL